MVFFWIIVWRVKRRLATAKRREDQAAAAAQHSSSLWICWRQSFFVDGADPQLMMSAVTCG
jgi:hypothetical protein